MMKCEESYEVLKQKSQGVALSYVWRNCRKETLHANTFHQSGQKAEQSPI
jgi:hypothetical protein